MSNAFQILFLLYQATFITFLSCSDNLYIKRIKDGFVLNSSNENDTFPSESTFIQAIHDNLPLKAKTRIISHSIRLARNKSAAMATTIFRGIPPRVVLSSRPTPRKPARITGSTRKS